MIHSLRTMLRLPVILAGFMVLASVTDVTAQKDGDESRAEQEAKGDGDRDKKDPREMKEEEAASGPRNLRPYASITSGCSPRRLAPGQSGELKVVVALRRNVVILSAADIQLKYPPNQGPISMDAWTITDPAPSTTFEAFASQPVYDDTFTFTVPIRIADNAEHRKYPTRVQLVVELANGGRGQPIGDFAMGTTCMVEVGDPLPVPKALSADVARPAAAGDVDGTAAPDRAADGRPTDREGVGSGDLVPSTSERSAGFEPPQDGQDWEPVGPSAAERDSKSLWLLVGGAALVLVVALLVLQRRR